MVAALLWRTGRFSRWVRYALLLLTVLLGFVIVSPMLLHQFQRLVVRDGTPIGAGLLGATVAIGLFFLLAFLFDRHFCGYLYRRCVEACKVPGALVYGAAPGYAAPDKD